MKNRILKATLAILMVIAFGANASAVTVDKTASVSATADIGGVTTMSILPTSIVYGTTSVDAYPTDPTDQKVVITYTSNYDPWKIAISTNNLSVPTKGGGDPTGVGRYAKGGLASTPVDHDDNTGTPDVSLLVIAGKWFAKDPASGTTLPLATALGAYNFIKDKRDEDDPDTTPADESWATAFADGYANIAYGNAGGGVCVDPTKTDYEGDPVDGSIAVYMAGLFGTGGVTPAVPASAGNYSTSFIFELYHE